MVIRGEDGHPVVLFDGDDRKGSGGEWLERRSRHEFERLLYVALTRSKHTLVLVDDRELFSSKSGLPKNAQARRLRMEKGNVNEAVLLDVPSEAMLCPKTAQRRREQLEQGATAGRVVPLRVIDRAELEAANERADVFIKRNPSGLVLPPSRAAEMDSTKMPEPTSPSLHPDYPGKAYGTWWHTLIESIRWQNEPASWQPYFDKAILSCPDPERAQMEWLLFGKAMAQQAELRGTSNIFHSEMPFLWRMSDKECVEGIIDLAIQDAAENAWLIVDWKTNRIGSSQERWLRGKYEPQLAAYRAALKAITGARVHAAIYSTTTGAWMAYEDDALDSRWEELARSPEAIEEALCS
jgi:ATP-dependent exoDNAse (exonuclease V) beta subunit